MKRLLALPLCLAACTTGPGSLTPLEITETQAVIAGAMISRPGFGVAYASTLPDGTPIRCTFIDQASAGSVDMSRARAAYAAFPPGGTPEAVFGPRAEAACPKP
ncbi:hypothetical protein [Pseudoroseicyclus sp. CXY001]|uniref:hypothetical protein n=1 Tax=Pseudoroseicyclus sp. CXY001 TaxID=3242492 RepID=UPI0035717467